MANAPFVIRRSPTLGDLTLTGAHSVGGLAFKIIIELGKHQVPDNLASGDRVILENLRRLLDEQIQSMET
jgi:hypothetical protein